MELYSGKPMLSPQAEQALWAALDAGEAVRGTTSPNPPVGCAIFQEAVPIHPFGEDMPLIFAVGGTEPAGGRHAERVALDAAGDAARGASMVVTLEPCNHTGRTGPCTEAIVAAGIERVIYLTQDPNPVAAGGAQWLQDHGVKVIFHPYPVRELEPWLASVGHGRVSVTAKFAATLDGFTAAVDGTSQWITGPHTREAVHADRAKRDAIIIGTGTALADNPSLTARRSDGALYENQPRRVVVGTREVPQGNLTELGFEQYATPREALDALYASGARDVLVEGGAELMHSMFELDVVDAVQAYVAPMILGAGRGVVAGQLAGTLAEATRYELNTVWCTDDDDVVIEMSRKGHSACSPDW
nr:Diaminohydroxyphosphoribosylaminopyrimidine deaminase / 5-amino-6-(5-phosphoribosylamino)uracil reductase [Streptococcus thermophilus]